jgi:hypothetical protein
MGFEVGVWGVVAWDAWVAQFSSGSASIGPKTRTPGGELGHPSFQRPYTDDSSQNSLPL